MKNKKLILSVAVVISVVVCITVVFTVLTTLNGEAKWEELVNNFEPLTGYQKDIIEDNKTRD